MCRENPECLKAMNCRKYSKYWNWHLDFDSLVNTQDRLKLDRKLPDELVLDVLKKHSGFLYVSKKYLRARRLYDEDVEISFIDAYLNYGGSSVEQAYTSGLVTINGDGT